MSKPRPATARHYQHLLETLTPHFQDLAHSLPKDAEPWVYVNRTKLLRDLEVSKNAKQTAIRARGAIGIYQMLLWNSGWADQSS